MVNQIFAEISVLIAITAVVSIIVRILKQPLIVGYIITGILVGPAVLNLINEPQTIEILGKFGIVLLLFIIGLSLNVKTIKELGRSLLITGISQVILSSVIIFMIVKGFGFETIPAIYISIGLSLSSTIVILKLFSDNKEQNRLHGKIATGILLVQDVIATFVLLMATASTNGGMDFTDIFLLIVKGILLVFLLLFVSRIIIRPMVAFFERSQELLFLSTIAWGLGTAALFLSLGFSLEVGALFAGIAIASMPYAQDVSSRLRPLRDFFIVIFFVSLGAGLEIKSVDTIWLIAIILCVFVTIFKPIIVMSILGILGYKKKTSFKAAIAMGQVSEFSLIFILMGLANKQLSHEVVTLVMMVALITFAISSYQIIYSDNLYKFFEKRLKFFEKEKTNSNHIKFEKYDAIIFGYRKGGIEFARAFSKMNLKYLIIDHNPDVIDEMARQGYDYMYGDVTSYDLLEEINFDNVKSVVSTITDQATTEFIVSNVVKYNSRTLIICSADSANEASKLYEVGATYVMMPHTIGTEKISGFIAKHGLKKSEFKTYRDKHLIYIANSIEKSPEKVSRGMGHVVIDKMSDFVKIPKITK
jgi:Kef-type K+ transport system membrane component KefB/Trk K+ transport system NAD-binding subunit